MAKIYVFGVGGTGSRVIKALVMLLASGVQLPEKFTAVVPILIDPDTSNGDLNRTMDILEKYQSIRNSLEPINRRDGFFSTKITTLHNLINENTNTSRNNFLFNAPALEQRKFKEFLNFTSLSSETKDLLKLLYTDQELDSDMSVGFKGKPNIGSVVLNELIKSSGYQQFNQSFQNGDAIFIISSIFGGTGAAGFPILIKNFRNQLPNVVGSNLVSASKIGAVSFLPYFNLQQPTDGGQDVIESGRFSNKAKSALSYYQNAMFSDNSLDAFYYLGYKGSQKYLPHALGKADQRNNANFLELSGALAVLDFCNEVQKNAWPNSLIFKEFGINNKDGNKPLTFQSLGPNVSIKIKNHLSKFMLFRNFFRTNAYLQDLRSLTTWVKDGGFTESEFFNKDFYSSYLNVFFDHFGKWISEMEDSDPKFLPFHAETNSDNILNFIQGFPIKESWIPWVKNSSSKVITEQVNKDYLALRSNGLSKEELFVQIFDRASSSMINKILKSA